MKTEPTSATNRTPAARGLLHSTGIFSCMTLISRLFGLLRDMAIAHSFGASPAADAFWVAFKIPNFLRRLFAEGSFVQAFVPILTEYKQKPRAEMLDFISHVLGTLAIILLVLTLVAMLTAPWLIKVVAPGFAESGARYGLATDMLRVTFPYIFFISLTAFVAAILNSYGYFASTAFAPVLLNLCLIAGAWYGAKQVSVGVMALAWSVCVAGVVQLLFLLFFLWRLRISCWPRWGWHHSGVRRLLDLMLPTLLGSSASQVNLLVDNILASLLQVGSVSWLYYADRLSQFPLGIFGVAIATVILPHLSQHYVTSDEQRFSASIDWALRLVLLIACPAALALGMLSEPIMLTLFNYGHFSGHDAQMAARALLAFAPGLAAFMLVKVLIAGFYARQNTRTPVRIGLLVIATNSGLSLLLIKPLAHAGLALATSLSAWLNVILLFYYLCHLGIYRRAPHWFAFGLRLLVCNLMLGLVLLLCAQPLAKWLQWDWQQRVLHLGGLMLAGITVYLVSLVVSGLRWRELKG